jgi:hypothetical protein
MQEPDISELIQEEIEFHEELDEMFKSLVREHGYEEAVRLAYGEEDYED